MEKILLLIIIVIFTSCEFKVHSGKISDNNTSNEKIAFKNTFPEKNGFVNDFEKIFNSEQISGIQSLVNNYEKKFGREIYVITTSETYGYNNYDGLMSAFFQKWNVGKLPEQNGLVILLSKSNRKFAITAGLQAQESITDENINKVIGENVIPKLKENDFFGGTKKAVEEIIEIWK